MKRTATIVLGGGALAAWLAGAATSRRDVPDPVVRRSQPIDARGADLAAEIARLQERMRPTTAPGAPARNLFLFQVPPPPAPRPAVPEPAAEAVAVSAAPQLPPLRLSGIAEDPGPDGPVRIAFISGGERLYMVREGDQVTPRYRVLTIGADAVEIADVDDGTTRRLALR